MSIDLGKRFTQKPESVCATGAAASRRSFRRTEDGGRVNHKRVERIWREEGLKVQKKRRLGHSKHGIVHDRPEPVNANETLDCLI